MRAITPVAVPWGEGHVEGILDWLGVWVSVCVCGGGVMFIMLLCILFTMVCFYYYHICYIYYGVLFLSLCMLCLFRYVGICGGGILAWGLLRAGGICLEKYARVSLCVCLHV